MTEQTDAVTYVIDTGQRDESIHIYDPDAQEWVRVASADEWARLMAFIQEQGGVPNLEQIIRPPNDLGRQDGEGVAG